ncbi:MAG: GNAT family N-acetyltransferase [Devosia sp.]|nr:GNAT family N-acetyltransferase [Devosia sp.]
MADAAVLAAIHHAAFGPADAWSAEVIGIHLLSPGAFTLMHAAGGMVMARVAADEAEILTFAVTPEARRQGIGRRMLAATMMRAAEAGAVSLFLEVDVANDAARRLYEAVGFVSVGTRRGYYEDGSDAQVMRASLQVPSVP